MKSSMLLKLQALALLFVFTCYTMNANSIIPDNNPPFPGCKAADETPFRVLLIIDKSGSIRGQAIQQVKEAITDFAYTLSESASNNRKFEMGIIDFSSTAAIKVPLQNVKGLTFKRSINHYTRRFYTAGNTNFVQALTRVEDLTQSTPVDIAFFISDGNPTIGGSIEQAAQISAEIKSRGTYMFGIALGDQIDDRNIQRISGPDHISPEQSIAQGADWMKEDFDGLANCLVVLANSLIDSNQPKVNCPQQIQVEANEGDCGGTADFNPTALDECSGVLVVNTDFKSGTIFPIGETTVTATATDLVGNQSECQFIIKVIDTQRPSISCPPSITISCDVARIAKFGGIPEVSDNCGTDAVIAENLISNGNCPGESIITRVWTVTDGSGLQNSCEQTIQIKDDKPPVIVCPQTIEITGELTEEKIGGIEVNDNCSENYEVSHSDQVIAGDCDWRCTIERTWEAMDDCGNTSNCAQLIEKSVDIIPALNDPIILGITQHTFTITKEHATCILDWMPYHEGTISALPRANETVQAGCRPGTNATSTNGKITNPLLGETLKLTLFTRLNPTFKQQKVKELSCSLTAIVNQGLSENATVEEFLSMANKALGNRIMAPHLQELTDALKCINAPLKLER